MKIALFKRIGVEWPYDLIKSETDETYLTSGGDFVRISEYIEVDFPPLHSDEIVGKQLDAIDKTEADLRNKFQAALNVLEKQRAELRAITVVS